MMTLTSISRDRVLKLNNGNLESYDNQLVINPKHKLKGYTYATA